MGKIESQTVSIIQIRINFNVRIRITADDSGICFITLPDQYFLLRNDRATAYLGTIFLLRK